MCGLMANAVTCQIAVDGLGVGEKVISFKQQTIFHSDLYIVRSK